MELLWIEVLGLVVEPSWKVQKIGNILVDLFQPDATFLTASVVFEATLTQRSGRMVKPSWKVQVSCFDIFSFWIVSSLTSVACEATLTAPSGRMVKPS